MKFWRHFQAIRLSPILKDLTWLSFIALGLTIIGRITFSPIGHYFPFALIASIGFGCLYLWRH
ncbi:hypothetical protein [Lactiplantibacillus mudanjiangensis]|uniref:hypothetical protein n=1 Tax=Lactiplantibacillus mudanjiangensis TaxID=1296538 RepID=UPI001031D08B|nr:hypothetical protein [Lactiplantibacillus mudanjiangensis]